SDHVYRQCGVEALLLQGSMQEGYLPVTTLNDVDKVRASPNSMVKPPHAVQYLPLVLVPLLELVVAHDPCFRSDFSLGRALEFLARQCHVCAFDLFIGVKTIPKVSLRLGIGEIPIVHAAHLVPIHAVELRWWGSPTYGLTPKLDGLLEHIAEERLVVIHAERHRAERAEQVRTIDKQGESVHALTAGSTLEL